MNINELIKLVAKWEPSNVAVSKKIATALADLNASEAWQFYFDSYADSFRWFANHPMRRWYEFHTATCDNLVRLLRRYKYSLSRRATSRRATRRK